MWYKERGGAATRPGHAPHEASPVDVPPLHPFKVSGQRSMATLPSARLQKPSCSWSWSA
jgi:hypothetical protein